MLLFAATADFVVTSVIDDTHDANNPLVRIEHKCVTASGSRLAVVTHTVVPQKINTVAPPQLGQLGAEILDDFRYSSSFAPPGPNPATPLSSSAFSALRC